MAESVFGKPIDTAVKELSDKIGTVPNGQTVEGQISALNSNIAPLQFIRHYDGNDVTVPFAAYCSAICVLFQDSAGSVTFDIRKTGAGATKTLIAGQESVMNGVTLTAGTNTITFSATNTMHFTLIYSNIT